MLSACPSFPLVITTSDFLETEFPTGKLVNTTFRAQRNAALGLELTVTPWRANIPITINNCNFITYAIQRCLLILTLVSFYLFVLCFNYTFALYCSLCCVTVPWNQYSDADYDVCVACCVLFCIMTLASFSVWWNTAQNYMHRTHICPVLWLLVCHAYLLCTLKKLIYHNE